MTVDIDIPQAILLVLYFISLSLTVNLAILTWRMILLVRKGGRVMGEKKQARLVDRRRNSNHGGTCEIWDIGNECGIYVDFNPHAFLPNKPETMAFPFGLRDCEVTSWIGLGVWYEDATGGKAIRELGYEPVEGGGTDDSAD
jgi:hypothetical protein